MPFVSTNAGGMTQATPNVCLTPSPPAPSPVPVLYPSIGQCAMALAGTFSLRVRIQNKNVLTLKTQIARTSGDEAGVGGGVASGMFSGPASWSVGSIAVNVEGAPAVRHLDPITSNGVSPNAPLGAQITPSQMVVLCNR